MKSDYRIRSLRANFSKRGWVWSSQVQSGPVRSRERLTFLWPWLLENIGKPGPDDDHLSGERQSSTTDCGSFSTNSLITTVYTIDTLCLRWVGRILFHGGPVHPLALLPKQKGPAKHGPGAISGSCFNQVLKFGSSDEALNAQSPRMGFATFTPAIFKPLEDRG